MAAYSKNINIAAKHNIKSKSLTSAPPALVKPFIFQLPAAILADAVLAPAPRQNDGGVLATVEDGRYLRVDAFTAQDFEGV